jgi:hypothetical protein
MSPRAGASTAAVDRRLHIGRAPVALDPDTPVPGGAARAASHHLAAP